MFKGAFKRFTSLFLVTVMVLAMIPSFELSAIAMNDIEGYALPRIDHVDGISATNATTNATYTVGSNTFNYLDLAITAAGSNGTIVVASDGAVAGSNGQTSFTIPKGVTLYVPYDTSTTSLGSSPNVVYEAHVTPTAYRTLTLNSGTYLTVNGSISLGSKICATGQGDVNGWNCCPTGPDGRIEMNDNSKITLNNGANLYAWGYIYGDGSIDALSGSTVYECFQLKNWRGGSAASNWMGEIDAFLINQFYVQNIEVPITIFYGSSEKLLAAVNADSKAYKISVPFIGTSGMFILNSGASVTKDYIENTDRIKFSINGSCSIGSISLTVDLGGCFGTISMDSSEYRLPIPNNYDIVVESGTTTINSSQRVEMLAGSSLRVEREATLSIAAQCIVYDSAEWGYYAYPGYYVCPVGYSVANGTTEIRSHTSKPGDAIVDVNGTVVISSSDGFCTTISGAQIVSSLGGGIIRFNASAPSSSTTTQMTQSGRNVTAVSIDITSAQLLNGDGSYTETAGATNGTTFSYCAAHDKWEKNSATHVKVEFETNGGNQIDAQIIDKGTKATRPSDPEKAGYTFAGWFSDEDLTNEFDFNTSINENVKLYAKWNVPSYTVTWVDEDGTVLETDENVPLGTIPTFDGETPNKEATAQYTYTFNGWSPAIGPVEGDQVYTATYKETVRKYRIVFWNEDGSEEFYNGDYAYGVTPVCNGTPSKSPTAGYTYEFAGWASEAGGDVIDPLPTVEGDASYYAVFTATPIEYTVKWSINGEIQEETYTYNEVPEYKGSEPVKEADNTYRYTFAGWSKSSNGAVLDALDPVTKNVTYYAVFTKEKIEYTVVFVNHDGTELQSGTYSYNDQVYYVEPEPQRDGDAQYSYTFTGWSDGSNFYSKDGDLPRVTANTTYTAQFESTLKKYTVTWIGADGNTLKTEEIEYGTMPVYTGEEPAKQSDWQYDYVFDGWNPEIVSVTGDARYTAKFKAVLRGNIVFGVRPVLDGILSLKFYIVPAESAKAAKLTYTYTYGSEEITKVEEFDLTDGSLFDNSTGCVVLRYTNIQSGCIARDVVLTIYDENGEEQEILSRLDPTFRDTSYSYCVADWSRSIIAQYGDDESKKNTVELAKAIINYGYYSAEYFKLRFDGDYTNAESGFYGDLTESDISVLNAHAGIKDANSADVGLLGCRVILEGATTLRVYFKNPVESATVDGQACEVIPKDNMYYVELVNIASPNLDKTHTFKVSYNGSEYTFEYSVLSWVNSMISSSSTKQETYDLAKAIYLYWKAASAYFAQ